MIARDQLLLANCCQLLALSAPIRENPR